MRRIYLLLLTGILFAAIADAQVTTNGGSGLNLTYPDLATAITALNAATITNSVVITLTGNETAPVGGYAITQLGGTSTNTVTIQGSGSTITAGLQVAGSNTDAVFKVLGGDWISIQSFTIQENAGNTVVATGATNTMTEWGVALLRASTTDGAQNNTIQNNIISLNKTYPNSWGIYSNVRHDPATPQTSADITAATGANNGNKVYGNVISNVNYGIVFVGSGAAGFFDVGNDIGGTSGATGNTLTNWGSNTVNSGAFTSVSATMWGIFVNQETGLNVSYNSLTSATGIVATTLRGIFNDFSVTAPTGTFTNSITNNTITLSSANTTGTFEAIRSQGLTTLSTSTININTNTILNCAITGAASSSALVGIVNSSAPGVLSMSNNIIQGNTSTATTGGFTGVSNTGAVVTTITMNNNQIGNATGGAITFSAATSGSVLGLNCSGGASTCSTTIQGNDFRGIVHSVAGSSSHTYITATGTPLNLTLSTNTFTNLNVNTTGTCTFISHGYSVPSTGSQTFNNNSIVTGYTRGGASGSVIIMTSGSSSAPGTIINHTNNNFSNITVSGTSTITGITNSDGATSPYPVRTVTGNTFSNWTAGTGTISVMSYSYFGGTSSVSSNTITNINGQGTITGITINNSGAAANPLNVASNIITGLSSTGTGGSVTGLTCSNSSLVVNINGNTINTLSSTGASSTIVGLAVTGATLTNVFQNAINTLSGSGATSPLVRGISVSGGTTVNVFKNKIYDLSESAAIATTAGAVNGLLLSGGTAVTSYNNLIGDLRTPAANLTDAIRGINITSTSSSTTQNVYYNTVYLAAISSGTNFGTTGIFHTTSTTATTAALNLRNNIIVNNSTPVGTGLVVAYRRSSGAASTLANYGSASNNNLFYAGTPGSANLIYSDGTSTAQTLAAYKAGVFTAGTIAPRDAGSVTETVSSTAGVFFQSFTGSNAGFLHIVNGLSTQVESGAVNVAPVTDDYDADTRQGNGGYAGTGTAPDIGADEFAGVAVDLTAPSISYTNFGGTSCTTDRTLSAAITDASGVNTTSGTKPRLYFRKQSNANTFNDNTSGTDGWKYVEATNAGSPFSFTTNYSLLFGGGGVTLGDVIEYFVVAQDNVGTPNVGINTGAFTLAPASVALAAANFPVTGANNYAIVAAGLSGTVSVGAAQTYHSLTEAGAAGLFNIINTGGLSGNLTVNIVDASITETGATALNAINYNGCVAGSYTVTIKPSATSTLTGTVASGALIKINGATNVTIDGSNSGSTDRSLTITNAGTTSPTAISLVSLGTGLGAANNTIKNCNISTGISTGTGYGVAVGGSTPGTSGADNDNVTIQNNAITVATVSIYAVGTASVSTGGMDNLLVSNNSVTTNTTLQTQGIQVGNGLNGSITGNTVSVTTSGSVQPVGISLETGFISSSVTKNFITKVVTTATGGYGGRGITVGTGTATSNLTIANNVIYGVNGSNYSSFTNSSSLGIGIGMIGGSGTLSTVTGGVNLYYNSVNMYGSYAYPTSCITAGLYVGSGASALNIKDNVFVNTLNNTDPSGTTSKNYAVYSAAANTAFTTINYNDYYASGAQGVLGFLTADQTTIAAWKTATAQDVNSISADPLYGTPTVLQPSPGSPLVAAGTPIGGITTDITGFTRSGSSPTIGAYEQAGDFIGPTITYTVLGNTLCGTDRTLSPVTITDGSGVNITAGTRPRLYFKKSTDANTYAGNTSANNGWKYVEATGAGGSPFSFTTNYSLLQAVPAPGDIIQYFVVAQDLATPNVSINSGTFAVTPASVALTAAAFPVSGTINTYSYLAGGLSTDVTIGAAGTYTSLTKAGGLFAAINSTGLTNNITATILDATVAEDGSTALNSINYGCAGSYTLIIKPASGVTATLTGSNSAALIKISGADYVTIDGSNNGSASKDLTIENTNTGTSSAVIWIASTPTDGATNITVKNSIVKGNSPATTFGGIIASGSAVGAVAELANTNLVIQNNTIIKSSYGVASAGSSVAQTGTVISGNTIGSASATDYIGFRGLFISNSTGAQINNNNVFNIITTSTNPTGFFIGAGVTNTTINANRIDNIKYTGTGGYGGKGMDINTGNPASNLVVSNNMISNILGDGWSDLTGDAVVGIRIGATGFGTSTTGGINLYYNTINLTGSIAGYNTSTLSAALYISSTATALDVEDNIFASSIDNTTVSTDKTWAINSAGANTAFTSIDFNDYWVSGAAGVLGYLGSDRLTLTDIQTGFGANTKSQNGQPTFISATDLHLLTPDANNFNFLESKGGVIAVTTDIDAQTRPNNIVTGKPDIGADEFVGAIPSCNVPTAVAVGSITTTSASVSFTCAACTGTYIVEYGLPGFTPGVAGIAGAGGTVVTGAASPIAISVLSAATTYDVYVRQSCGGASYSTNSPVVSFTTLCNPLTIPYSENFDAVSVPAIPVCSAKVDVNGGTTWNTSTVNPRSAPNDLDYNYNTPLPGDDWWFTPGLSLTGGTSYRLSFWYRARSTSFPEGLEIKYGNAQSVAGMTSPVLFSNTTINFVTYTQAVVDFIPASTGVYYIGFHDISLADEFDLHVDDINVDLTPACSNPTGVSVSSITATTASVSFTSGGSSFIVEYGAPGFTPGTGATAGAGGTIATGAASPIALSGLTSATTYDVYVRQICAGPSYSANSTVVTFNTLCNAVGIPYTENFDAVTAPVVPTCITVTNNNADAYQWTTSTSSASSSPNSMYIRWNSALAMNDWFFTRGLNLTAGTSYRLTFNYNTGGFDENLKIMYGTSAAAGSMTTLIHDYVGINNTTYTSATYDFIPGTTGVYYIGFNGHSDPDQFYIVVDDISVDLTPACAAPTGVTVLATGATTASVSFVSGGTSYIVEYGLAGFTPGTGATAGAGGTVVTGPASPIAITGLTGGPAYDVYVRQVCAGPSYGPNSTITSFLKNDDAPGALTLTVGAGCTGATETNVNATASASEKYPSCSGSIAAPVWYKFVAPASGAVRISTDLGAGGTFTDSKLGLFSATNVNDYTTFNIISCDDDGGSVTGSDFMSVVYATGLTPGTTYYVAVDKFSPGTTSGTFCIAVDELSSTMLASASNNCSSATYQAPEGNNPTYAGWVPLMDLSSNLIALVKKPTGGVVQDYNISMNVNPGAVRTDPTSKERYLDRNFHLDSAGVASIMPTQIQLFFLNTELAALAAVDPAAVLSNLKVTRQTGTTCQADFVTANGTNSELVQTGSGTVNGASWISTTTPGFSNFFIHSTRAPLIVKTFLQGAYSSALGRHKDVSGGWAAILNANALSQPYNTAAFGNYNGGETVPGGFFTSNAANALDIIDWVLLEVKDASLVTVARRAALLREDGKIVDINGDSLIIFNGLGTGNFYLTVRHRNHLGLSVQNLLPVTAKALGVPPPTSVYDFDFTTATDANIFGDALAFKVVSGVNVMICGNANSNNTVKYGGSANDPGSILTYLGGSPTAIIPNVYTPNDVNLDGTVKYGGSGNDPGFLLLNALGSSPTLIVVEQKR